MNEKERRTQHSIEQKRNEFTLDGPHSFLQNILNSMAQCSQTSSFIDSSLTIFESGDKNDNNIDNNNDDNDDDDNDTTMKEAGTCETRFFIYILWVQKCKEYNFDFVVRVDKNNQTCYLEMKN